MSRAVRRGQDTAVPTMPSPMAPSIALRERSTTSLLLIWRNQSRLSSGFAGEPIKDWFDVLSALLLVE
jgi:hypothetical protein